MAKYEARASTVARPQSDCVELKWAKCPRPAPTTTRPQSDCVELKFAEYDRDSIRERASIGLCGIEILGAVLGRPNELEPQSDCVELKWP